MTKQASQASDTPYAPYAKRTRKFPFLWVSNYPSRDLEPREFVDRRLITRWRDASPFVGNSEFDGSNRVSGTRGPPEVATDQVLPVASSADSKSPAKRKTSDVMAPPEGPDQSFDYIVCVSSCAMELEQTASSSASEFVFEPCQHALSSNGYSNRERVLQARFMMLTFITGRDLCGTTQRTSF